MNYHRAITPPKTAGQAIMKMASIFLKRNSFIAVVGSGRHHHPVVFRV
jgi:hypothetical protein